LRELGQKHAADVIIFGHSHQPEININTKPYVINPGSITLPRNAKHQKSYIVAETNNGAINFVIKYVNEGDKE
jgi:putative phosphoesterase